MEEEPNPITWTKDYTRIIVETDEEDPVTVAVLTGDDKTLVEVAAGYRVRMRPKYN